MHIWLCADQKTLLFFATERLLVLFGAPLTDGFCAQQKVQIHHTINKLKNVLKTALDDKFKVVYDYLKNRNSAHDAEVTPWQCAGDHPLTTHACNARHKQKDLDRGQER